MTKITHYGASPDPIRRFSLALVRETSTQYGRTPRPAAILGLFLSIGEKSGLHSLSRFCFAWWMVGYTEVLQDGHLCGSVPGSRLVVSNPSVTRSAFIVIDVCERRCQVSMPGIANELLMLA